MLKVNGTHVTLEGQSYQIAEIEAVILTPAGVVQKIYLYFLCNENYSPEILNDMLQQNPALFGENPQSIMETRRFDTLQEADDHVRKHTLDNWNQSDVYVWPPQKIL